MAGDLGLGASRSNNVDLNIVPFIDLMSCLTAFLLVTAVWVGTSQLETHPQGLSHDPTCPKNDCDEPKLSVLVENDRIFVGISRLGEFERIDRTHTERDWEQLATTLKKQKASVYFAHKDQIEVAALGTAARPIHYQTLVTAMDVAVQAGFANVALTDAGGLSAQPY